jgi:hypothetical protein
VSGRQQTIGPVGQDAAHRGQVPALLDGGGQQMHNRPDRGGTGRLGPRVSKLMSAKVPLVWCHDPFQGNSAPTSEHAWPWLLVVAPVSQTTTRCVSRTLEPTRRLLSLADQSTDGPERSWRRKHHRVHRGLMAATVIRCTVEVGCGRCALSVHQDRYVDALNCQAGPPHVSPATRVHNDPLRSLVGSAQSPRPGCHHRPPPSR